MYCTKAKILKSLFPFTLRLLSRERTLTGCLPYTVSKLPSNLCWYGRYSIFSKSAVDLFTSKTYPVKSRHLLAQKNGTFYQNVQPKPKKVAKNERRRLQTDFQFQQNEIKRLHQKYNVEMFSSLMRGGKAYAAKQKIREFRKLLFKSRKAHRQLLPALDSIQKSWYIRRRLKWTIFSPKNTVILPRRSKKMQQEVRNLETFTTSAGF